MSIYNALYGRDGHGVGPNEPEKKGFARFCQMFGRDLGQLLGTNLMVCILCLPAALGVSLGVTLFSLPLTVVLSAATGLLVGIDGLLLAECCLRSLQNDPSQWLPRAKQSIAAHWKSACAVGAVGTLLLGLLCFVSAFLFEAAAQQGYYPGLAVLVFLALDFLILAVGGTLCMAALPLEGSGHLSFPALLRRVGRLLLSAPGRCIAAGVVMLAGIGGMILLFPVSVFWAVLFGFWLPGLAAMQTLFPVLRQEYGVQVRTIPRPAAPEKPLTAQEQKKRSRANWWYYNWGIVTVAAMVIVGVAYVAHGLLTTVDPDYTVAVVTAEALPDEAVQRLQTALADYAEDANGDGAVIVQVNNYTWSADAALTDMNGQMAGATQMNTDLANGESKIWILEDPDGFEQAYGALSEKLGAEWQTKLMPWSDLPALSALELGSYNTAADGSQTVDIQSRFAGYSVAVFDASDALWQALNS
ncbi:hypothetical protein [Faecalibacterium prausnitzii]|uniref:hypothetical protein n=1 Tax=Faecalibacterium prausnitzii TaxID=853 RepID=UPI0022E7B468|nr:hypothetical protein [Faecalibacterium prausnitzii]